MLDVVVNVVDHDGECLASQPFDTELSAGNKGRAENSLGGNSEN